MKSKGREGSSSSRRRRRRRRKDDDNQKYLPIHSLPSLFLFTVFLLFMCNSTALL